MYNPLLLPDLRIMLQEEDAQGLSEFCNVLHPAVTAEVLEGLSNEDVWKVLAYSSLPRQVEIFEFMSLKQQVALVEDVDRTRLSRLLEEMSADDRVDLLNRMDPEHVEQLMPLLAQVERSNIRKLLSYPEHSAGSIMTTEYAWLPEEITVREALDRLRQQAPHRETIYYVYILDDCRRLDGFLSLQDLILAPPNARLADIMKRDLISVRVDEDQERVAQELAKYDFLAIPVVDKDNQLVGIITYDDIIDIVQEEATEDAYRAVAVQPLKDSYLETPFHALAWKRGIWLMFLAAVACMTAQVLDNFESVSREYVWLVLFLPLVLASGGNAGSQSATLVIRALAVDDLTRQQKIRLALREPLVGMALGLCLAAVGFIAALGWFGKSLIEAAVVAMSVSIVVVVGTINGALLPLGFRRFGMDPAIMSNPLISAIGDILGVIIYYTIAVVVLRQTGS